MIRIFLFLGVFAVLGAVVAAQAPAQTSVPVLSTFLATQDQPEGAEEGLDRRRASGFFDGREEGRRGREASPDGRVAARDGGSQNPPRPKEGFPGGLKRPALSSPLEIMYTRRAGETVGQFGYDLFGVPTPETREKLESAASHVPALPAGGVQDDFILNIGDEVEIVFTGQRTDRSVVKINGEGMLLIGDFPPIPAAGRSIGQVRVSIEAAAANLYNTQAYISLASVRQIGVLVAGHVALPGRQNMTVFHTVLDALMEAGGVQKTGSLRRIKLVRHGRGTEIDLYDLLVEGAPGVDLSLRDGDRIIVPPVGPTVVAAGGVKRPGIYELREEGARVSLKTLLNYAGGVLAPGDNRLMKLGLGPDGTEGVEDIKGSDAPVFGDGDILLVGRGFEKRTGTVELRGHTRQPGFFPLKGQASLAGLLKGDQVLGPDIYPLIGVIERRDPAQLTEIYYSFPVRNVIAGEFDRALEDGDIVHLFSKAQITSLDAAGEEGFIEASYAGRPEKSSALPNSKTAGGYPAKIEDSVMAAFLMERSAFVRGAVRRPGAYPVADGVTLDSLLAVAGGLALEANTGNIEITSAWHGQDAQDHGRSGTERVRVDLRGTDPATVEIRAGDAVRVNQQFKKIEDQSVLIVGEVAHPGRYDLAPGDRMSDLIARAGGLGRFAYPEGAIFSRRTERQAEEQRFRAAARDLRRATAAALEKENGPSPEQVAQAQALIVELEEIQAVGRITVEADPAILKSQPELDILLEPGDRVFIPKRPLTVRVTGEVLSPASLQFRESKDARDYIDEAGGPTFNADKDRTFVLLPDGSAQPLSISAWNHRAGFIPPGSTIVVPRDPEPFDFIQSAKDVSQILANLAITGVFIDDVRDGD